MIDIAFLVIGFTVVVYISLIISFIASTFFLTNRAKRITSRIRLKKNSINIVRKGKIHRIEIKIAENVKLHSDIKLFTDKKEYNKRKNEITSGLLFEKCKKNMFCRGDII